MLIGVPPLDWLPWPGPPILKLVAGCCTLREAEALPSTVGNKAALACVRVARASAMRDLADANEPDSAWLLSIKVSKSASSNCCQNCAKLA